MIDILEEEIKRRDALGQAPLNGVPLVCRNDAGQQVLRENPLSPFIISIDSKRDSLVEKRDICSMLASR